MHWTFHKTFRHLDPDRLVARHFPENARSFPYGETPALTATHLLRWLDLPDDAKVVDLGFGRGLALCTAWFQGYEVAGVEYFPEYVQAAERAFAELGAEADLRQGDMLEVAWPSGDVYWISSTAFPPDFREKLLARLTQMPAGTQVITQDWSLPPPFETVGQRMLPVTWGTAYFSWSRLTA